MFQNSQKQTERQIWPAVYSLGDTVNLVGDNDIEVRGFKSSSLLEIGTFEIMSDVTWSWRFSFFFLISSKNRGDKQMTHYRQHVDGGYGWLMNTWRFVRPVSLLPFIRNIFGACERSSPNKRS